MNERQQQSELPTGCKPHYTVISPTDLATFTAHAHAIHVPAISWGLQTGSPLYMCRLYRVDLIQVKTHRGVLFVDLKSVVFCSKIRVPHGNQTQFRPIEGIKNFSLRDFILDIFLKTNI